jgi:hypothetical protein
MNTVRRLSAPFVTPITRFLHHEENSEIRRSSTEESAIQPPPSDPANSSASLRDADIPLILQDSLYLYQLANPPPLILSPIAFHTADIVWRYKDSERIYKLLQKKGIITEKGEIRTAAISKAFAHQFAFLSSFAQRRVIGLLFWWEEEQQRLKRLFEQEMEIKQVMQGIRSNEEHSETLNLLKIELERVKLLINMKPSTRTESRPGHQEELPAYSPPPSND